MTAQQITSVTESDVEKYIRLITAMIRDWPDEQPSAILAPVRGGLIPGVYLSHTLGIPLFPMNYSLRDFKADLEIPTSFYHYMLNQTNKTVLLVDDIVDSGDTMQGILAAFEHFSGVNVLTAALLHNEDQPLWVDFAGERFSRSLDPSWFSFFWEK